jgi:NAD(P)-dependent dehydrogenase (short-subunit alcohol dehydrogenase family)
MNQSPDTFAHLVAVVTGGGSGIGAAVTGRLRAAGAEVLVADLTPAEPGDPSIDVTDAVSVAAFADDVRKRFGRCDLLVNCAGAVAVGTVTECTEPEWNRVFDVNVRGTWETSRHFLPMMPPGSAIVNVASAAGLRPIPGMAAYVASKAAVVGLTRAMALDHAPQQVRVNCVCPGLVDTPLAARAQEDRPVSTKQSVTGFEDYLIKRQASADEIAAYICFLGSSDAGYITGAAVAVDGGRTLH